MSSGTPETPAEEEVGWAALAAEAAVPEPVERSAPLCELLTFTLADDPYALPIERVREIVRLRPITPVPRVPRPIRGVISLRGEIAQVIDLRLRLGLPTVEPTRTSRIVVLRGEDGSVAGLLVDAVRDVLRLPEDAIRPPPTGEADCVQALCARDREFVSLLDLDRVLSLDHER